MDAAAARLDESWIRPDVTGHMVASGLAGEFAATLCAYGMAAAEVDHMRGRAKETQAAHSRQALEDGRAATSRRATGATE